MAMYKVKGGNMMKKYHYNPTKPHQYILSSMLSAAAIYGYMLLICCLSYTIGGIL